MCSSSFSVFFCPLLDKYSIFSVLVGLQISRFLGDSGVTQVLEKLILVAQSNLESHLDQIKRIFLYRNNYIYLCCNLRPAQSGESSAMNYVSFLPEP